MMFSLFSRRTSHQHSAKAERTCASLMHLESCTIRAWVCWLSTTIGHSVNSVQQTSQKQEEPQVQMSSYIQEIQEEITDSEVSFNRKGGRGGVKGGGERVGKGRGERDRGKGIGKGEERERKGRERERVERRKEKGERRKWKSARLMDDTFLEPMKRWCIRGVHVKLTQRLTHYDLQRITTQQKSKLSSRLSVSQVTKFTWTCSWHWTCTLQWRRTISYRRICLSLLPCVMLTFSYCMRSQPRVDTPQQAHACSRSFRHWTSFCTIIDCPDTQRILPSRRTRSWATCNSVDM